MKKVVSGVAVGFTVLAIGCAVAYANLNRIVRSVAEKQVPGLTFDELQVHWNVVSISGVKLKRGERTVFEVASLRVYPSLKSLLTDELHISSIEIERPYVYLERRRDGSLRMPVPDRVVGADDGSRKAEAKPAQKDDGAGDSTRAISIGTVEIRDGRGDLIDHSVHGAPAKFALTALQVSVEKIHLPAADAPIPFELSATLAGKRVGRITGEGWYNLKTDSAELELALGTIFLPHAEPYYRSARTTAGVSNGTLDLQTTVKMTNGKYVAQNHVQLAEVAFAREGLFLGVPVVLLANHLKDPSQPFVLDVEVQGSLDGDSRLQQQLAAAVAKELGKKYGKKAAESVAAELQKSVGSFFGQ